MIFFDFDGTVVNVWPRYHQVFLTASEIPGISLHDYVSAKQSLVLDKKVAQYFGYDLPERYFRKKRILLESADYLRLDSLLVPIPELDIIFSKFECRFLTSRRRAASFFAELSNLGLSHLSNQAIVLDPDSGISKKELLAKNFPRSPHIVVGDSASEWETADLENVHVVLVRTGLRRPEDFPLTQRHTVVPSISTFITTCIGKEV